MALRIENTRFVKVWDVKDGKFGKEITLGTSRKVKGRDGAQDTYRNCNWWNVRFVGDAGELGEKLSKGDVIKVNSAQIENVYDKEKGKAYFNMVVFDAEYEEGHEPKGSTPKQKQKQVEQDDDEFPF